MFNQFKEGNVYVVGKIQSIEETCNFPGKLRKIKVLEITKLTILVQELDYDPPHPLSRFMLDLYNKNWKIVQIVEEENFCGVITQIPNSTGKNFILNC